MVTALAIALAMVYLAGNPFALDAGVPPGFALIEPQGELAGFPARFRWSEAPGALVYEVSVWRLEESARELLFRQRGTGNSVEVRFDNGARPGEGSYRWEVRALGIRGREVAAEGEFRVKPDATGS